MNNLIEKEYKEKTIYKGRAISFKVDTILLPNSKKATREYIDHPGAVALLAVDDEENFIFVRQYRYPVKEVTYEIPAGKLNFKGDNFLKRAKAELEEETGYKAKSIKHMIDFWPTPTFSNELLKIYLATGLVEGESHPDDDEFLNVIKIKSTKALDMIKSGVIKDAKTIIAVLYYFNIIKGGRL